MNKIIAWVFAWSYGFALWLDWNDINKEDIRKIYQDLTGKR